MLRVKSAVISFIIFSCILHSSVGIGNHEVNHEKNHRPNREASTCDIRGLEQKLHDKINDLRRAILSTNRYTEQQLKNTIEQIKTPSTQEQQIQTILTALRLLSTDVAQLQKDLSELTNATRTKQNQEEISDAIKSVFEVSHSPPSSCLEVKNTKTLPRSGVYAIQTKNSQFMAYCDMEVRGGGWTTIQNRVTGDQDFYLNWDEYKLGFGNVAGEHWLGLKTLHELTSNQLHELLIELVDVKDLRSFALYSAFSIGSEEEGYPLKVLGEYTEGNGGDALGYHAGSKFSTRDRDNDYWAEGNCAQSHGGGWWYKACDKANLNGRYIPGDQPDSLMYQPMYWDTFGGPRSGLKHVRMLIRPV